MWLGLAFLSAFLLGCYEVNKKVSLAGNAVIPILFLNTLVSSLVLLPLVAISYGSPQLLEGTIFFLPKASLEAHGLLFLKAALVLSSWIFGYFALKHLPLTIVGPIKSTQPVLTLLGALLIFQERLNLYQWVGVIIALLSFYLLSIGGKKEGIDFKRNKYIWFIVLAAIMGALSGLYDKYLMLRFDVMTVQVWYTFYQCLIMFFIWLLMWYPTREKTTPFVWRWNIVFISLFLLAADFVYFYALGLPDSMISIVSMVRRSNVVVTFLAGAVFFHERNLRSKAFDVLLVVIAMVFLYLGTRG